MSCPGFIRCNEPLARYTSFRIGGPADYFVEPTSVAALERYFNVAKELDVEQKILGGGTNVLIPDDGVRGMVVRLSSRTFGRVSVRGDRVLAPAGVKLSTLVARAAEEGLSGLEPLAGIPGTVGGAAKMNAGGRHGNIGDVVEFLVLKRYDGTSERLDAEEIEFGYRRSSIPAGVITQVALRLRKASADGVASRTRSVFMEKKQTQPLGGKSAECVFKNPPGQSAGKLIDQAGLKGKRVGDAIVSERHANFILNVNNATARDVNALIERIRESVFEKFGVQLELEIDRW